MRDIASGVYKIGSDSKELEICNINDSTNLLYAIE